MSKISADQLYELLPAIYRTKDAEQEQSLRALFAILENDFNAMENDIQGLYDNWFIETCDEWVVPYIGDLLKVPVLHSGGLAGFTLRSYVANVLAYRRRKGTASVLEQMAHDVSGWPTRAVEFFKSLATTQQVNNVRAGVPATLNLRDSNNLELLGSPFQHAAYRVDVRSVAGGYGKYNIPNMGLFVWRLQSYSMNRVAAAAQPADLEPHSRFRFSPLDLDLALFNLPQTETEISHLAEEHNVPGPLRRRPVYDELQARRVAISKAETPKTTYFGPAAVFSIYPDGATLPLLPEEIMICDLTNWETELLPVAQNIKVQVDPQLGRLAFPGVIAPAQVEVSYAYGFSADVGAGPYNRSESLENMFKDQEKVWWAGVSKKNVTTDREFNTLSDAVQAWNDLTGNNTPDAGVITIHDNASYDEALTGDHGKIIIHQGKKLLIVAAQWLRGEIPLVDEWSPELGLNHFLSATRLRPHIKGNISVSSEAEDGTGALYLNGLLLESKLTVLVGELGQLELNHCTLVPKEGGLVVNTSSSATAGNNAQLAVILDHSICGTVLLPDTVKSLHITDSIIDAVAGVGVDEEAWAITGLRDSEQQFAPPTTIQRSTLFGKTDVKELSLASEVIFTQIVMVERMQVGCVRFSYVPPGSLVPRRFRCQPDLALVDKSKELEHELNDSERRRVMLWMRPVFTSEHYGDPGYAQLNLGCPKCPRGIRIGAEDGSEMGIFSHLKQPQREANIRTNLTEYLRFGMKAEIFYVN